MPADPTNIEQLMVEFINRARADPAGEIDRLILQDSPVVGAESSITQALNFFNVDIELLRSQLDGIDPAAPLAWNETLGDSAHAHSQLMLDFEEQSHFLPGESSLVDRFEDAGYTDLLRIGENIFAFANSPLHAHAGFFIDWGMGPGGIQDPAGHRLNILNPNYTEVGIGLIENVSSSEVGPNLLTQHFGDRSGDNPRITGVVIDDADGDDFYDIGEGLGGVQVQAVAGALTFTAVTYASGGYSLEVPSGVWTVSFSGGALDGTVTRTVTVSGKNVKVDAEQDDAVSGSIVGAKANDTLIGTDASERIIGTGGDDILRGLGGDDTLEGRDGADTLEGGSGLDTADYSASPWRINVNLALGRGLGADAAGDSLTGIENIVGTNVSATDFLTGDDGDNSISGLAGNDEITGGRGNDELDGGSGADRFFFDTPDFGQDLIVGWEDGQDLLDFRAAGLDFADFTKLSAGDDTLLELTSDPDQSVLIAGVSAGTIDTNDFA